MITRRLKICLLATAVSLFSVIGFAADQIQNRDRDRDQDREQVYGWQLMTPAERTEHRNMMRSFNTEQERETYRKQHHERMQARAREQGVTLPEEPGERGRMQGGGAGQGPGAGRGK